MNKTHFFFNRVRRPRTIGLAVVMTVALASGRLAFCGEIHDAAKAGNLEQVKALLKANPDLISSKDDNGVTPLHWAAIRGHKDVAEYLIVNNADVNAKSNTGLTPLHAATSGDSKDVAELLLNN